MEAEAGKKLEELTEDLEYFPYYREVYETVLGGMVGEYEIEEPDAQGRKVTQKRYGLKAFHPIAKGFPYTDYDEFWCITQLRLSEGTSGTRYDGSGGNTGGLCGIWICGGAWLESVWRLAHWDSQF